MAQRIVALASDHAGLELKAALRAQLLERGEQAHDLGPDSADSVDYPDYAGKLAEWMKQHPGALGVLVCGSGLGMSMAANRHSHIRAALCQDGLSAQLSRRHNDANVLCLGARLIGVDTAKDCLNQFLAAAFEGGRHIRRVEKIS